MKPPNKKPCVECPLLRKSWKGFVGEDSPAALADRFASGEAMPCHMTVDYEQEGWRETLGQANQCAGQAIFLANTCKMPRPGEDAVVGKVDRDLVFSNKFEFIKNHENAQTDLAEVTKKSVTDFLRKPAKGLRVKGHKLTLRWSGEYGAESESTGECRCGWEESCSSQAMVREEYRHHLRKVSAGKVDIGAGMRVVEGTDQ